jgi:GGDEF domain-containing protein
MQVGLSIGAASFPEDGREMKALLEIADRRMYLDKSRRKARPLVPAG